jgi:transcription elongation factor GreA
MVGRVRGTDDLPADAVRPHGVTRCPDPEEDRMSIAVHQPAPITREGFERLRAELAELVTVKRREVAEWVREARDDGGEPGENADVAAALEAKAALESRIGELRATLALVRVAEPPVDGVAGIGRRVRVEIDGRPAPVEFELVGAAESDPSRGWISVASPMGRALTGHRAGDVVEVEAPGGMRDVRIVAVGAPAS